MMMTYCQVESSQVGLRAVNVHVGVGGEETKNACWIWTPLSDEISSFLPRHARDKHNENVTQLWRLCFLFYLSA
jgi:hypothetical protein